MAGAEAYVHAKLNYAQHIMHTFSLHMALYSSRWRVCCCVAVFAGLAIDVGRQRLYYSVDEGSGNAGEVGELSTDGTDHKVLNWRKWGVPQSVVIDVDNR